MDLIILNAANSQREVLYLGNIQYCRCYSLELKINFKINEINFFIAPMKWKKFVEIILKGRLWSFVRNK